MNRNSNELRQLWGFSPRIDLQKVCKSKRSGAAVEGKQTDSNFLLIEPGDIRHILTTVAACNILSTQSLNFTICESSIENIAREIFLLQLAFSFDIVHRVRVNAWLEIYGNNLITERTHNIMKTIVNRCLSLVCNHEGILVDMIDLSKLKHRQRDQLEEIFKSWVLAPTVNAVTLRDERLRQYYGQRYDSRTNLADWDYHESVKPQAGIIHSQLYRDWRSTGVAFEFSDGIANIPNPTMLRKGETSFCLDIVNSPYYTFGISTNNRPLREIINRNSGVEQYRHNCCEISVHELLSDLWACETATEYILSQEHDVYSGLSQPYDPTVTSIFDKHHSIQFILSYNRELLIANLMVQDETVNCMVPRYPPFDAIYISCMCGIMSPFQVPSNLLTSNTGLILVEDVQFLVSIKRERKADLRRQLHEMMSKAGYVSIGSQSLNDDVVLDGGQAGWRDADNREYSHPPFINTFRLR